jgi:hypothetical protein
MNGTVAVATAYQDADQCRRGVADAEREVAVVVVVVVVVATNQETQNHKNRATSGYPFRHWKLNSIAMQTAQTAASIRTMTSGQKIACAPIVRPVNVDVAAIFRKERTMMRMVPRMTSDLVDATGSTV